MRETHGREKKERTLVGCSDDNSITTVTTEGQTGLLKEEKKVKQSVLPQPKENSSKEGTNVTVWKIRKPNRNGNPIGCNYSRKAQ